MTWADSYLAPAPAQQSRKTSWADDLISTEAAPAQQPWADDLIVQPNWADRFQESLAKTIPGQLALRAEQGASSFAGSLLSLGSTAFGSGKLSESIHNDEKARGAFLQHAEKGGSLSQLIGDSGAEIANETAEFVGKLPFLGVAGPSAFIPLMGAESFDKNIKSIKEIKPEWSGGQQVLYSGVKAAVDMTFLHYLGKIGEKLGVYTLERAMTSPAMRDAAAKLAEKYGANKAVQALASTATGATADAGKMGALSAIQQGIDQTTGVRKDFDWKEVLKSMATGAAIRVAPEALKAAKQLETSLRSIPKAEIEKTIAPVVSQEAKSTTTQAAPETPGVMPAAPEAPGVPPAAPEAPGVPPAAPEAAAPPGPVDGPVMTKNARMRQLAAEFGRDTSPYSPTRRSDRETMQLAIEAGIPDRALDIAAEVSAKPRPLKDIEEAGFRVKLLDLRRQYRDAQQAIAVGGDDITIAVQTARANKIAQDFQRLKNATEAGGTALGRGLRQRQIGLESFDELSTLGRLQASKQAPLTEADRASVVQLTAAHEKAAAELQQKQATENSEIAEKFVAEAKKAPVEQDTADLYKRLKELYSQNCDLE